MVACSKTVMTAELNFSRYLMSVMFHLGVGCQKSGRMIVCLQLQWPQKA